MSQDLDIKILSYIISEKKLLLELKTEITPNYILPEYRKFYNILLSCFNKYKEIPTLKVMQENAKSVWNDEMGQIYSDALSTFVDNREFPVDVEKIKKRFNVSSIHKFGKVVFQDNWDGYDFKDLKAVNSEVKKLSATIDNIYSRKVFKEGSLSDTAIETWKKYQEVVKNPDLAKGIHLGYKEFDRITNGLRKSELMLVGGTSSAGKSALVMNMAINAWLGSNKVPGFCSEITDNFKDDGVNVLFFSIEMPYEDIRMRCDSCIAGVPFYGLRDGRLTPEEEERFRASLKFQRRYDKQLYLLDIPRGCTMEQIESKYIDICHKFVPELVIIDYITLMESIDKREQDWLNLGKLAEQMHEFCRRYELSVISPVQLKSKDRNRRDLIPMDQEMISRSKMLSDNSNIVLNIESRKDEDVRTDMIIRIAKMRNGEKTVFTLHKRMDIMRICDVSLEWNPESYEEVNNE